jgi:hypothetical protein
MEDQTFLFVQTKPYKTFCGVSLKLSVMVIAVLDFVTSMISLVKFAMQAGCTFQGEKSATEVLKAAIFLIGSFALIFAFNAAKGIILLKYRALHQYSMFKQAELILQTACYILYEFFDYYYNGSLSYPSILFIILTRVIMYFIAKAVWSIYYLIKNGETFLVLEGTS